ncbi:MAG: RsmE family RNA methyltransferase [Spirochaetaceae bacterium]|nr:RsmE family RNA methyltransferase [Spirochaetaceae bacterium]
MNIVLFHSHEINSPLPLADQRVQHLQRILRKEVGDTFEAGIINGPSGVAQITAWNEEGLSFEFTPTGNGKPLYPLTMIIGFPRPIQLKRLLRDIASLGVSQVHLCGTELGEKSYLKASLSQPEELAAMLKDGSIQAKSTHVPQVFVHRDVAACLEAAAATNSVKVAGNTSIRVAGNTSIKVALDNVEPTVSLNKFLMQQEAELKRAGASLQEVGVVAAIGSERGWTAAERRLFCEAGFTLCSMGQRVLRTETAATTATAIILSQMEIL